MFRKIIQKVKGLIIRIDALADKLRLQKNTSIEQAIIVNQYRLMKKMLAPAEMPPLHEVGFHVYSQFEEDGLLLYIFSIIGSTNKRVVEICAGDGTECMSTNLIINHGWYGLLFDGNKESVKIGKKFFATHSATFIHPPIFKQAWITQENINQLIADNGVKGEIDLLSLDMDGNDYYIMKAITVIKPRVIICETHNAIPHNFALTIPYQSEFSRTKNSDFMSVSLLGMKKLLTEKGYRLVGSHRYGFNAIFMRNDIGADYFPEISIESVHANDYTQACQKNSWPKMKDLPWKEIQ